MGVLRNMLRNKEPVVVKLIPPTGSKIVGHHPKTGEPIYERVVSRVLDKVQKTDPATGQPAFRKNQVTGETIIPVLRNVRGDVVERFTLFDDQKGNVWTVPYVEKSAAELEEERLVAAKARFMDELAGEAAKGGISAAELVQRLMGNAAAEAPVAAAPEGEDALDDPPIDPKVDTHEDEQIYPKHIAGKWWELSDKSRVEGKKADAVAAEAALHPGG